MRRALDAIKLYVWQQQGSLDSVITQSPTSSDKTIFVISSGTDTPPTPSTCSISHTPKELIKCSSLKHPVLH